MNKTVRIDKCESELEEVTRRFGVRLTGNVRETINHPLDPVGRQYLPDIRELDTKPQERPDPIGDKVHSPVKGIVHRHKDRALFKIASVCAVNCRFCFRKTMLGTPEETLSAQETKAALCYIENHPEIREVILTGGDPLILSERRLSALLGRLEAIEHLEIIRMHSRIPVADPQRLTGSRCRIFEREKPVYMIVHVNHAQELNASAAEALLALHKNGVVLLSQSVLLRNVNDNAEALETLFRRLLALRVKPYYLHHPDMVPGTGHFRVSIEKGRQLMRQLRARTTGLALPTYVLDIPGGHGKILLEEAYIKPKGNGYIISDHHGNSHFYP